MHVALVTTVVLYSQHAFFAPSADADGGGAARAAAVQRVLCALVARSEAVGCAAVFSACAASPSADAVGHRRRPPPSAIAGLACSCCGGLAMIVACLLLHVEEEVRRKIGSDRPLRIGSNRPLRIG